MAGRQDHLRGDVRACVEEWLNGGYRSGKLIELDVDYQEAMDELRRRWKQAPRIIADPATRLICSRCKKLIARNSYVMRYQVCKRCRQEDLHPS